MCSTLPQLPVPRAAIDTVVADDGVRQRQMNAAVRTADHGLSGMFILMVRGLGTARRAERAMPQPPRQCKHCEYQK